MFVPVFRYVFAAFASSLAIHIHCFASMCVVCVGVGACLYGQQAEGELLIFAPSVLPFAPFSNYKLPRLWGIWT